MKVLERCFILLLKGYKYGISPLLRRSCRFEPTCSAYMMEAITIHGPLKGLWLGIKRLSRCHPWGDLGFDPPPPKGYNHQQRH